jgi:hypothetical protein
MLAAPPASARSRPASSSSRSSATTSTARCAARGFEQGHAVTALGNCYRFEGHRFAPLERQWEFSMREAVLLGERDYVVATRARLIELTQALCDELDLDAALEVATDPFFAAEAASLRTFQAMRATKLELRLAIGGGATVAAASFNLHGSCFATPMDIRARRRPRRDRVRRLGPRAVDGRGGHALGRRPRGLAGGAARMTAAGRYRGAPKPAMLAGCPRCPPRSPR